jgi:hypothetical protein
MYGRNGSRRLTFSHQIGLNIRVGMKFESFRALFFFCVTEGEAEGDQNSFLSQVMPAMYVNQSSQSLGNHVWPESIRGWMRFVEQCHGHLNLSKQRLQPSDED